MGAPDIGAFESAVDGAEQARSDLHVQTVCLLVLAFFAVGLALYLLRPVLVPFVLALFFAACLKPLIRFQRQHWKAPQPVAVLGAVLVAIAFIVLIGIRLGVSIGDMRPIFVAQFDQFVAKFTQALPLQRFGFNPPNMKIPDEATSWLFSALGKGTDIASATVLVIIFTLFILLGRRGERPPAMGLLVEIEIRVQRYINQMVLLSAVTGLLVGLVLFALGVKFAAVFGFLAFLMNFIPTIGSVFATLLPLPIILLSPQLGLTQKVLAIAIPAALQIYLGNAVQPRVLGRRAGPAPNRHPDFFNLLDHDLGPSRRVSCYTDDGSAANRPR